MLSFLISWGQRIKKNNPDLFVYLKSSEIHPHDRFLHRLFLRRLSARITPNQITWFRLICVPAVFGLFLQGFYKIGVVCFLLVAFTDALDGSLARITNRVTRFGMLLDPLADKVLIGSLVFLLVFRYVSYWLAVAIVAVEVLFILSALFVRYRFKTVRMANIWGKIKMITQVIAVFLTMAALTFNFPYLFTAAAWVFGVALGFAILSFFTHGL